MRYFLFFLSFGFLPFACVEGFAGTMVKNPDLTYTYQPTPEETMVLEKAEQAFGQDVMQELVENWIQDRARYFAELEKDQVKEQLDALTGADRQKILDMLEGRRMIR